MSHSPEMARERVGVLLTGGAGGLGRACAMAIASRGHAIALVDSDLEGATRVATEVADATGARVVPLACDIADPHQVRAVWDAAEEKVGPVGVLVNNAARLNILPFRELPLEEWQATIAVNLTGTFLLCQVAANAWVPDKRPGSIVNVASVAALKSGLSGSVDYGASKAGVVGLTRSLAVELGPHGIRVNAVAPGSFFSPMNTERFAQPGYKEAIIDKVPLHRIGDPEEIAAAVTFLALDATYVNGVVVPVDGALTVRM